MNTIKELVNSGKYNSVSFREKSIPRLGSPSIPLRHLRTDMPVKIDRMIKHKNGDVTLVTKDHGWIKFWVIRDKKYFERKKNL